MNEQERRGEILKAEELIRKLVAEAAEAANSAKLANEAITKLDEASKVLGNAGGGFLAAEERSLAASASLNSATEMLQKTASGLEQLARTLPSAVASGMGKVTVLVTWAIVLAGLGLVVSSIALFITLARLR